MKASTMRHLLTVMKPGQPITTQQLMERCNIDREQSRKWLGELVDASLVRKEVISYPGVKHRPEKRAKYQYVLVWRPI